ncbi:MAG: hypothetical protein AABP62_18925 [Planctomycetota bacterium]
MSAFPCASFAAAADLTETLRSALEANAASISPLRVEWTQSPISRMSIQELCRKVGDTNHALLHPRNIIYARSGSKFYHHSQYYSDNGGKIDVAGIIQMQRHHTAFDGNKLRSGSDDPNRHNCFVIDTPEHFQEVHHPESYVFYTEYFDAAGIYIGIRAADLFSPPKSVPLMLLEAGGEIKEITQEVFENNECLVLIIRTATALHKFWLAPKMGHTIVRIQELDSKGRLLQETANSSFENLTHPNLWLPRQSLVTYYRWHTAPDAVHSEALLTTRISVSKLTRTEIEASQFVIDATKGGSRVGDSTIEGVKDEEGYVQFNVPASEIDLNRYAGKRGWRSFWLIAANGAVFVVGGAFWMYRRWRNRTQ